MTPGSRTASPVTIRTLLAALKRYPVSANDSNPWVKIASDLHPGGIALKFQKAHFSTNWTMRPLPNRSLVMLLKLVVVKLA